MAKNYIQAGDVVDYTNKTAAAIASDDVVILGSFQLGIALVNIAVDAVGAVMVEGIFTLAKAAGVVTAWQKLWWSATTKLVYNAPVANGYFIGYAAAAELTGSSTVKVLLEEFSEDIPRYLTLSPTGAVTLTAVDFSGGRATVLATNTAAQTLNLPSVALIPPGSELFVKKLSGGAFVFTIKAAGSELIAGANTFATMDADGDQALFVSTGAAWVVVASTIA
jgi:predicted RecA/RadA family phage recombinase